MYIIVYFIWRWKFKSSQISELIDIFNGPLVCSIIHTEHGKTYNHDSQVLL